MDQVTNLIQWKNLTDEQKADFDFENYKYEFQNGVHWNYIQTKTPYDHCVYRLVVEDDKWYTYSLRDASEKYSKTVKGATAV